LQVKEEGALLLCSNQESKVGAKSKVFSRLGIVLKHDFDELKQWLGDFTTKTITVV
jgi:hypothetical protein